MADNSPSTSNLRAIEGETPGLDTAIARSGAKTLLTPQPTVTRQLWHEDVAKYLAVGLDHTSIARMVNCSPKQIGKLLGQGWFQELLLETAEKNGTSPFLIFKGAMVTAFGALVEICSDSKAPPAARVAASRELLNRFAPMGEAVMANLNAPKPIVDPVAEYDRLRSKLSGLRASEDAGLNPSASLDFKQE